MGSKGLDPRRNNQCLIKLQLRQQYQSYTKADPPPERVKPIPVQVIQSAVLNNQESEQQKATSDMIIVGFYFMLRPGEYTYSTKYRMFGLPTACGMVRRTKISKMCHVGMTLFLASTYNFFNHVQAFFSRKTITLKQRSDIHVSSNGVLYCLNPACQLESTRLE